MRIDHSTNILIVGLGLIGGSYAKGFAKNGFDLCAIDSNPDTIQYALDNYIIAEGATTPDPEMIGKADFVIFALYPHIFKEWIAENQKYFKPGVFITDVTGVKGCIVVLHPKHAA